MCHVCPSWLSFILYNPLRKTFSDREKILDDAGITADAVVLEVGAGNGFLTEALAERAGEVISVELQNGMVKKLKRRVERFGNKVKIITADISSYSHKDRPVDACLLYFCFHEIHDKPRAVINITGALKAGGILSIYEPSVEVGKRVMQQTISAFESAGFQTELQRSALFTRFARLRKL